ncbi:hypothetical protein SAMN05421789_104261 [Kaistella chaponensis]|uniref:Uncharacterized protein n=1 Tax=Kaistella chaponensis TaxID=713588 RepID=A0A1N7L6J2_9FLAO|nr:hypothetical protein [Kaistella chaponensis]SIS69458.1 hypothetical protein SAMN05421789_104261 [Kaistella chaponensis]
MSERKLPTPSQFYRHIRPEYFSDSKIIAKVILPREQLDFELSKISTNQKHDNFETLCTRLAEKLISPNLIPQVGPTGGGDGKTDSETYPVSNFISDRWFVADNKWNKNENWAFAISAKKDWKPKVKSDIKNIIETNRGYTKIFFFSNQKISSKNKKEIQDQTKIDNNIELTILDAEWILEKVYSNKLLNDVIESLNLSRTYLQEKNIGSRDTERFKELEELENQINSTNRFFEIDFQLIEDCLESAIISRMLELPRAEVTGRFQRALNFANKLNNIQLKIRVHYQFAWTLINWYDDYKLFHDEFLIVKELVRIEPNLNNLEFYMNLYNILKTISCVEEAKKILEINTDTEDEDFITFLNECAENIDKPSTALLAKFHLSFIYIRINIESGISASDELIKLRNYFELSKNHLDIAFEQLKDIVDVFDKILPDNKEYDNLIDVIAEIEATRISELTSGQTYLNRGVTKLENNLNKESVIYFGKASRKLAKDETQMEFYYCLLLLSDAYSKLDLYWASYNALVSATNIFANNWYTTGNLNRKFLKGVEKILSNEVIIGRIPVLLCWNELYIVLKRYFQEADIEVEEVENNNLSKFPPENMSDAFLSIRLLNMNFKDFHNLKFLPDIFKMNEFWFCEDASLYLLGNVDLINIDETETSLTKENLPNYFNKFANQPFVQQIAYKTNFLNSENVSLESQILGTQVKITFSQNSQLLILAENILAYFESFLATSFEEAFPMSENINISIDYDEQVNNFKVEIVNKNNFKIHIQDSIIFNGNNFKDLVDELLPLFIGGNYLLKDTQQFLNNLFEKDEVHERLSLILQHHNFLTNILTKSPKFFLKDWINNKVSEFNLLRTESPILVEKQLQKLPTKEVQEEEPNFKISSHKKIKAETIINNEFWDKAKWKAFGCFASENIPFGLLISFENGKYGQEIFKEWIGKFGTEDVNEIISITIIKGIDKNNPNWYKIFISKNVDKKLLSEGNVVSLLSRFHRMEPTNNTNLNNIVYGYERFKKYIFAPAAIDKNFNIIPYLELGILKTELKIINAWEIGIHDFEKVVITAEDNPIIPDNIKNAPILEVLQEKKGVKIKK